MNFFEQAHKNVDGACSLCYYLNEQVHKKEA